MSAVSIAFRTSSSDAGLAFVVIDRLRTSDALRNFALRALRLQHIETDGDFELYRPSREAAP